THTYARTRTCTCTHTNTHAHTHTNTHTHTHTHTHARAHTCAHRSIHKHTHTIKQKGWINDLFPSNFHFFIYLFLSQAVSLSAFPSHPHSFILLPSLSR